MNRTAETRQLLEQAAEIVELSKLSPERFQRSRVRREIRDSLLHSLFLATAPEDARMVNISTNKRRHVAFQAIDYLRAHEQRDVSLLDLCKVTGVSARTLAYAFDSRSIWK